MTSIELAVVTLALFTSVYEVFAEDLFQISSISSLLLIASLACPQRPKGFSKVLHLGLRGGHNHSLRLVSLEIELRSLQEAEPHLACPWKESHLKLSECLPHDGKTRPQRSTKVRHLRMKQAKNGNKSGMGR